MHDAVHGLIPVDFDVLLRGVGGRSLFGLVGLLTNPHVQRRERIQDEDVVIVEVSLPKLKDRLKLEDACGVGALKEQRVASVFRQVLDRRVLAFSHKRSTVGAVSAEGVWEAASEEDSVWATAAWLVRGLSPWV